MSKSHSADFAEQVTERENDEVLEEIKAETEASVMNVLAALARVREGTYGQCTRCGEAISPERLAAIPEAALCMSCAGK
ncbi:MAG: TraR/DksA C4-type zinc finger protein [Pseudomonadales bacterium]|nr:TraR/DksA C4-type zinc finger protein [Pseudomonadales bacterium]MCP5329770.1 TraR/DksA C4-type zinc finger protein [Pseudomonadales bacterium]MCP5343693.1 TraR/DksA C4-type zinc finger protein [Pseudomonadales bacterium]